jgi:hypothetical protein
LKNLLGARPRLDHVSKASDATAVKVSLGLTEQVKAEVEKRYPGFQMTRRGALETAMTEWLMANSNAKR